MPSPDDPDAVTSRSHRDLAWAREIVREGHATSPLTLADSAGRGVETPIQRYKADLAYAESVVANRSEEFDPLA